MKLDWKTPGKYEALGKQSLEQWLLAHHRGRAPSQLKPEIEEIVGHPVTMAAIHRKCQKLGLRTSADNYREAIKAALKIRPVETVSTFDPEAVWEATQALANALKYQVERVDNVEVDFTQETKPICIVELADTHIGGIGVDYDQLRRDVQIIAETDGMYCGIGGDQVDNFIDEFLLGGVQEQVILASPQWKLLEDTVGRLQSKILWARVGNHELWTKKKAMLPQFANIMERAHVVNVQEIGVLHLHLGAQEYVIEATHKFWGESRLNVGHTCQRLYDFGLTPADVVIVEHRHVPHVGNFWRHGKQRWAVRPGTYKTMDTWARQHGFFGADIAPVCLFFWPDKDYIWPMNDVQEAANYLEYLRGRR
ncbi:MAG: hypothetical protein DRJ03_31645 [Chloroflexi bacterium]|nr:MAG: hypothetical protein DRJ03_31645 [Chloroflexota bacterium]